MSEAIDIQVWLLSRLSENLSEQARQLADANNTFVAYHTRSALACALRQNRVKYILDCTCEKPRSASVALLYPIRALLSAQMPDAAILIARDGCISNHKFHASPKTSRRALQITPDKIATRTRLQRNVRREMFIITVNGYRRVRSFIVIYFLHFAWWCARGYRTLR